MRTPALLALAIALSVALVTVILKLAKGRVLIPERLALTDALNIVLFVVSLVSVMVALGSLAISIATYRDAVQAGKVQQHAVQRQQEALDASRKALEAVVATATEQQSLLGKSLAVSESQLK